MFAHHTLRQQKLGQSIAVYILYGLHTPKPQPYHSRDFDIDSQLPGGRGSAVHPANP